MSDTGSTMQPSESRAEHEALLAPGLYLVGTPIGHLEDITLRALRVLRSADLIACEDTRQTQKLLNHYGIRRPLVSSHEHNEHARAGQLLERLREGARIAVVSDAGMPGISDPGMQLASAAIEAGVAVYPVPGANAALSALVASGLPVERFLYAGFLPARPGERRGALARLAETVESAPLTLVFYEAPHRILNTLADVAATWGAGCPVVVARELTKLHEEFLRGPAAGVRDQLAARERIRGEITLLVQAGPRRRVATGEQTLNQRIVELQETEHLDEMAAVKRAARERGIGKSEAYREWQRSRRR